ncbi:hypothetical protein TgHK011_006857 [Trichoderma gracile]|nr:hypothetical protein TgHK011_006857 [Trichoderma gracile]
MIKANDAGYLNIRLERRARTFLWLAILSFLAAIFCFRHVLYTSWTLLALPANWAANHESFILSEQRDAFDVTFTNYSINQLSAAPYEDLIPPVLHHIALGSQGTRWKTEWKHTVQSCIDIHPGWETHIWTDETASQFVEEKFPDLKHMWDNYAYPVQRIDALRYMLLYEYGGVVLDMDLKCTRALGPLRRFSFVAPEAYPAGFSIGFMMANRRNDFVGALVGNLETYNKRWLGLPYATVMFSTGCHYASVMHAAQPQPGRGELKILPAPMHSLNGRVKTPIFEHLGSSSWHSYDARFFMSLRRELNQVVLFCVGIALVVLVKRRVMLRRRLFDNTYHLVLIVDVILTSATKPNPLLIPHSLFRRRLQLLLLAGLASTATLWMLPDRHEQPSHPFDARMLQKQYPVVWKLIFLTESEEVALLASKAALSVPERQITYSSIPLLMHQTGQSSKVKAGSLELSPGRAVP